MPRVLRPIKNFGLPPLALFHYLSFVVRKLRHWLLIALCTLALGGHWALLQTVAWTNMLATNLRTCPLGEALTQTFDGKHPCAICKVIKDERGKERQESQSAPNRIVKLDLYLTAENLILSSPATDDDQPCFAIFTSSFRTKPPTPPPRPTAV